MAPITVIVTSNLCKDSTKAPAIRRKIPNIASNRLNVVSDRTIKVMLSGKAIMTRSL